MKAILIDDEQLSLETLVYDVTNYCPEVEIVASTSCPIKAIELIDLYQPDIVMSDVQMPEMNVFTMLEKLTWTEFALILVTAYNKYAIKAFEFSAVDYLVKPIDPDKLQSAVKKAGEMIKRDALNDKLSMIFHNLKFLNDENLTLAIPTVEGAELVSIKKIIRIEADANYSSIYLLDGETLFVSKPLKHFYNILSESNFIRIHQSHLINTKCIKSYRKGKNGSLILTNGEQLPISRSYRSHVMGVLFNI